MVCKCLKITEANMASNEYRFITHWRVQSTREEIWEVLSNGPDLAHWWPSVYLDVQEIQPEGAPATGKVISLYTKGWLPYTLRWQFRIRESSYPHTFTLDAWGDLTGRGIWTFEQDGDHVNISYDWMVRGDKPLFRYFSFLLKPIFSANHRWAMAKGEESLRLELARRSARTPEERARIPAPPGPTFARLVHSGRARQTVLSAAPDRK
jgi:hypothetical protein